MTFELAQFIPLLGAEFIVETQNGPVKLILSEAEELPHGDRPESLRTPLSLIFTGESKVSLEPDNYWIEHPVIGRHLWAIAQILPPLEVALKQNTLRYYQILFS